MGLFEVVCLGLLAAVGRTQELQNCSADATLSTVTTTEDATALATSLECSFGDFFVEWGGEVVVEKTIRVTNGTSLNITGAGSGATADGNDITQLFVVDGGSRLHLSDMTLAHGSAPSDGGAIYAEWSSISLRGNTSFISNSAGGDGGAICAFNSSASCDGGGTTFINNSAGGHGGAMSVYDSNVFWDGDGTTFINNSAYQYGGAMFVWRSDVSWDGDGTTFINNSADQYGGTMSVYYSNVSWDGDGTTFINNSADVRGGAMYMRDSDVSWDGDGTAFINNYAGSTGGAMRVSESNVSWDGDGTTFSNNSADGSAGAIYVYGSNVSWDGDGTTFSNNSADQFDGGAMSVYDSNVSWDGDGTTFSNNYAGSHGGAMDVSDSNMSWDGDGTTFINNYADINGGATYVYFSNVSWDGDGTTYSNNYAGEHGGAMYVSESNVSWDGDGTTFSNNHADSGSGGAIYAELESAVSWNGSTIFTTNTAGDGGGAIALVDFGDEETVFSDATFIENSSGTGGALYVYNSVKGFTFTDMEFQGNSARGAGGAIAMYAGTDHEPSTFTRCNFSDNTAIGAGGAVETLSGQQTFISCAFEGNSADVGGAMTLGGEASVRSCSFRSNSASTRGLAVAVVGSANISDSSFEQNELFCGDDLYRQDTEVEGTKRFDAVCLDCFASWDECSGCSITRENVTPACVAPLDHTTAEEPGTVLETLNVTQGYWRATSNSDDILACPNPDACRGGQTGAESYCTPGYSGPYCAVCESNFAPSLGYTCTRCSSSTLQGLIAAAIIAALVAVCAIATIFKFLMSTELEDRNAGWFHRRVLRAVPVQSLKIIVVVWQILTQFADAASVTYPGVYQDFLSAIDIVNFDLGSVLAAGCMWSGMDFHDRLLLSTLGPLVVAGFLAMTYRIAMLRNGAAGNAAAADKIRHKHQTALLFLTFLVYSSVSSMVFQTFACETLDDGVEYLRADYSIHCTDAKHVAFEVYAGIMILVYPVGIPLLYAILLYQRRDVLSDASADKTEAQSTSSLWEPYRPERYYYEVVECGRRIMLTGVVVFIFPNDAAQIAITILISFVFFAVFELLSPYKSESEMWLARGGHVIVYFSMFDLLLLKVDVSSESDESQAVFAGVLVAGHVLMFFAIVIEAVGICYASRKERAVHGTVSSRSPPELRSPTGSDDDVPAFKSVPASWRPFNRQASVSEKPGPTRTVSETMGVVGRP